MSIGFELSIIKSTIKYFYGKYTSLILKLYMYTYNVKAVLIT